ncbi:unnamed protein product [Polarella glacialis]|uniref:PAS domain-containing protein n=1 Tax=Polarella glacialis TaxID=89957 RepID=A0A813HVC1_POLGL|nr:unnamed protein product [Polarella glacialis]
MAFKVAAMTMQLVELRKITRITLLAPFISLSSVLRIGADLLAVQESRGQDALHGAMFTFNEFLGLYGFLIMVTPQCFTLRRHYFALILMNLSMLYCVHSGSEMDKSFTYYLSLNERLILLRVGQAGIFGNFPLQFCLNIMATGFNYFMAEHWAQPHCDGLLSVDDLTTFSFRSELAVIVVSMAICVTTDWAIEAEARVTVESKTSRNVEATAQSLLSVLCDAVVRLGPDFRITTPSPQLAALLLKSPGPLCFEGKVFTDLVHPEDRESIARQLDSNTGGPVQLLRIRMPDADGRLLTVQAFHSPFLEMDDRVGHLLGLIEGSLEEMTSSSPVGTEPVLLQREPPPAVCEPAYAASLPMDPVSNRSSCSGSSCSSDNSDSTFISSTLGSAISDSTSGLCHSSDEIAVWLSTSSFEIVRTTPAFKMISGPSPEGDIILDWVRSPERFERLIQDWMQMMPVQDEAFVAIGIGGEATAAEQVLHMSAGIQIFCPPAARSCGIQYAAACSLEYHLRTPESFIFKLTLSEIQQHKLRRHATGRHSLHIGRQQDHRSGRSKSALAILSERGVADVSCLTQFG